MKRHPPSPEDDRRALALFEHLADDPGNAKLRARLARGESEAVLTRLRALEASVTRAAGAIPTLIPGSADCEGVLPPPERVGTFRLIERIGRGGMGDVWLGQRDDGLYDQKVAVKLIQRHALRRAAGAFEDERRFLAKLEHPNIARLIDGGVTEDGLPWLAMEYFAGEPIDVACEPLSTKEAVQLFIKAADAVQHAHSRLIAHADLKPSNILIGEGGRVKLLDFGIAGLIGAGPRDGTGSGPLTRDFASPERIAGAGPSVADDVYALGKTLSLILQGRDDPDLSAIATKAQRADANERYGSAAELIADLDRWRARLPVTAMHDGLAYRIGKFVERHRIGVFATGMALIGLSATSVVATSNYVRAESARAKSEARFGEVRTLSHFMLFDLYDQLARQPGTVTKRAEIAEKTALYLERLQLSGDAPTDLRLDTARSYRRLAAVQGLPGVSNLGLPGKAMASLAKAEALLATLLKDKPDNVDAMTERGWVSADRWSLHADNVDSPKTNAEARRWFDSALKSSPGNASARLGRITTEKSAGYDLIWSADKPAEALLRLKTALAELRTAEWPAPIRPSAQMLEIILLNQIGDAAYYSENVARSLAPYREGDALIDARIAEDGAIPQWLILKGDNAFDISGVLEELGGHDVEALKVAEDGVGQLKRVLAFGPDAAAEKKLLVLYGQQALVLEKLGRLRDALAPSIASVKLREARLARSPQDPQRMRDLAIGLVPNAELLAKTGKREDACAAAVRAVATWAEIKAEGHLGVRDARKNLPQSETLKEKFCKA